MLMDRTDKANRIRSRNRLAFYVLVFFAYFISRFVILSGFVPPIGLEECHTGAVASEIIHHGFEFPIEQYTPEYYETTIILSSLITILPVRIFGLVPFALELVPFMFSFGVLAVCCALLFKAGFRRGLGFLIACFFFCSGMFVYLTMDGVGSHIIALFLCMLILHSYYSFGISGRMAYFYGFAFFAGLGAFIYLSTLMYTALCVFVFVLFNRLDQEFARRVAIKRKQFIYAFCLFIAGYAPNIYFLIRSRFQNVLFLKKIIHRRIAAPSLQRPDYHSYWDAFLFQFDNRLWLPVMFAALFLICAYYILKLRKQPSRFNACFLLATIWISVIPFLIFIVLMSGRQVTSYYIYLMPMLFMMGGAVLALAGESLSNKQENLRLAAEAGGVLLLSALLLARFAPLMNFSVKESHRIYFEDRDSAFCYWRFGMAFSNYTPLDPDPAVYARGITKQCDRLDTQAKRNECYRGWFTYSDPSMMGERAIAVLGDQRARLLAMGIGRWNLNLNACIAIDPKFLRYFDDCVQGILERKLLKLHSISPGMRQGPLIYFPCMNDDFEYSGLRKKLRATLKQGTIDSEAGKCEEQYQDVRAIMTGYCSALDSAGNHCRNLCGSEDYVAVCNFVYEVTREARTWETHNPALHHPSVRK